MGEIASNAHILMIAILILVVILYALYVTISIVKRRTRIRDSNKEISIIKMDLISKQSHLQSLIEDSVTWTPRDLETYDAAIEDTKLLKGKLDTGMDIADVKTKRLELGNETHQLFETLQKIRKYEDRMFGDGVADRRGRK